jgi:hypothetical protein
MTCIKGHLHAATSAASEFCDSQQQTLGSIKRR